MLLCKKNNKRIIWRFSAKRLAIWLVVMLVCGILSFVVIDTPDRILREYTTVNCQEPDFQPYELTPGSTIEQKFTALGQSVGEVSHIYLSILRAETSEGALRISLYREATGEMMMQVSTDFAEIPGCVDVMTHLKDAQWLSENGWEYNVLWDAIDPVLTRRVMLGDNGWHRLHSGEAYRLVITNCSTQDTIYLLGNTGIRNGELALNGELQEGFLNLALERKSLYVPSRLLLAMVMLTNITVLLGLAMVLFTNVADHTLYLVLAIGFGIVTLFDLTPLYGFDMHFQFDSTYVLSNQMLGLDGAFLAPDPDLPQKQTLSYYRRKCDDYSQYQFYKENEVSANYTDMKAGLRRLFAEKEEQQLIVDETQIGGIGEQIYLYLPQAIGFSIARMLGLGMYPMLQLGRLAVYALFVATVYFAIRRIPIGKRILMILALMPATLVQTVSITRDAIILCMSFYLISEVLYLISRDQRPMKWEWGCVLLISALLAPCKMVYLPISFLWLLIIYRQDIHNQKINGKKLAVRIVAYTVPIVCFFYFSSMASIADLSQTESTSIYGTEAYSIPYILTHIPRVVYVFLNTMRMDLGEYLSNSIQLWDIDLGSSDFITILIMVLLLLESCRTEQEEKCLLPLEKVFCAFVFIGVFGLLTIASLQWTPVYSLVIEGFQGRYLLPVIPLLCLLLVNNRYVQIKGKTENIVRASCCIFPAIFLMNMYLWTIMH